MTFKVEIIADSIAPCGKRLTTLTATYPRFIHSEIMTHRDRARNAASSRAIPFPVMTEQIETNPVVPIFWGTEKGGMQTGDEIPEVIRPLARAIWLAAMADAVRHAKVLHSIDETLGNLDTMRVYQHLMAESEWSDLEDYAHNRWRSDTFPNEKYRIKIHKSIPNRIIEPWMWITVVMSATEWANFFRLRCHGDAEIHFQKIAKMMRAALGVSEPSFMEVEDWHLPYVSDEEVDTYGSMDEDETLRKASVARCARVSYLTHEGKRDISKDLDLFDRLVQGSGFGHWSAHEHVAQATTDATIRSGPFIGWKQYRKTFANENAPG